MFYSKAGLVMRFRRQMQDINVGLRDLKIRNQCQVNSAIPKQQY